MFAKQENKQTWLQQECSNKRRLITLFFQFLFQLKMKITSFKLPTFKISNQDKQIQTSPQQSIQFKIHPLGNILSKASCVYVDICKKTPFKSYNDLLEPLLNSSLASFSSHDFSKVYYRCKMNLNSFVEKRGQKFMFQILFQPCFECVSLE